MEILKYTRDVIGFMAGVYFFSSIPIYGAPFSGCTDNMFIASYAGCSFWPEFLRTFGLIILSCLICFHTRVLLYITFTLGLLFFLLGGTYGLWSGYHPDFTNLTSVINLFYNNFPTLSGALVAFALVKIYLTKHKDEKNYT